MLGPDKYPKCYKEFPTKGRGRKRENEKYKNLSKKQPDC